MPQASNASSSAPAPPPSAADAAVARAATAALRPCTDFDSGHDLGTSVARLRAATWRRWPPQRVWQAQRAQRPDSLAVGPVSAQRVVLERVQPFARNGFRPAYRGRFVEREGRVVLSGRFGMNTAGLLWLCAWFGGGTAITSMTLWLALTQGGGVSLAVPTVALLVMMLGGGVVTLGLAAGRGDRVWLATLIARALAPDADADAEASPAPAAPLSSARPRQSL